MTRKNQPTITLCAKIDHFNRYISRLFKTYRLKHKLTEQQFADQLGMTSQMVKEIEACLFPITVLDVFLIARFFMIPAKELMKNGGLS